MKPFEHFPLTEKEIEVETERLTKFVQSRFEKFDRETEMRKFEEHSLSTHPEVYRRVIRNLSAV